MGEAVSFVWKRCPDGVEAGISYPRLDLGSASALEGSVLSDVMNAYSHEGVWITPESRINVLEQFQLLEGVALETAAGFSAITAVPGGLPLPSMFLPPEGPVRKLRWRSLREEPYIRSLSLKKPLILDFVNAGTEEKLAHFCSQHGLLVAGCEMNFFDAEVSRSYFARLLDLHSAGAPEAVVVLFDSLAEAWDYRIQPSLSLLQRRPRVQMRPSSLLAFMLVEVATLIAGGERLMSCDHCRSIFIKRRTSAYCSDRCRVAAPRARRAATIAVNGSVPVLRAKAV